MKSETIRLQPRVMGYAGLFLMFVLFALVNGCSKKEDASLPLCYVSASGDYLFGGTYSYTTTKMLSSIVNIYPGYIYTISYSPKGRIVSTSTNGLIAGIFHYNSDSSLVTSITDGQSNSYNFTYNSSNQLTSFFYNAQEPLNFVYSTTESKNPSSATLNLTTYTFEYDDQHNPFTATYSDPVLYFWFYPNMYLNLPAIPVTFGVNNVTRLTVTNLANSDVLITNIAYTYTSNGYPLTATLTPTNNGTALPTSTAFFTYSNCK